MLRRLSEEAAKCYQRARECRERADLSTDPETKRLFDEMEVRWIFLAQSHELTERLAFS